MIITLVYEGCPITKKNHQEIHLNRRTGARFVAQSDRYKTYEKECVWLTPAAVKILIDQPCRVACVYFMPDHRRVDLLNLMAATHDILVKAQVLKDDSSKVIVSVDGSRVDFDKSRPRVEVQLEIRNDGM